MKAIKKFNVWRKGWIMAVVMCSIIKVVEAQETLSPLPIGATVPDLTIVNFYKQPGKKVKLSEYRGKLLLLDFWGVYCTACLAGMGHLDSLQAQFGDQLKVLLVTSDTADQVEKIFNRLKIKIPNLEVVTGNDQLIKLFPHESQPHHVWINTAGTYISPAHHQSASANNIRKALKGDYSAIVKKAEYGYFNNDQALLATPFNIVDSLSISYSLLLKGTSNLTMAGGYRLLYGPNARLPNGIKLLNMSALTLIQYCFNERLYGFPVGIFELKSNARLKVEVARPDILFPPVDQELIPQWRQENLFSYELKAANTGNEEISKRMEMDIMSALPYTVSIENRHTKYLSLERIGPLDSLLTRGGKSKTLISQGRLSITNDGIQSLLKQILYSLADIEQLPFVNNSNINFPVDISITMEALQGRNAINKELTKYGLAVKEREGEIPMLVIGDKNRRPLDSERPPSAN
ncbi:TlpA family protein disulfide reductase [Niabella hibiscisoli]|uniref:TlpA family protein disulfide reductase n=1 Tax=Niabella hibiscisoli TaxID=1825928 RepID=UPI001F0E99F3|nr:TlpA disulfide reductase family protein [Niabella hibiscisoli]MCH5717846.1 TlpA family protein disulfide reductase [Niabella hibiscisoli]